VSIVIRYVYGLLFYFLSIIFGIIYRMREKYIKLLPKFLDAVKEKEMSYCVHYSFVGKC